MKVHRVYVATLSGKLTCSEVMQLLMEQPTKPNGRKVESHAQMHTMDGFTPEAAGFGEMRSRWSGNNTIIKISIRLEPISGGVVRTLGVGSAAPVVNTTGFSRTRIGCLQPGCTRIELVCWSFQKSPARTSIRFFGKFPGPGRFPNQKTRWPRSPRLPQTNVILTGREG